MSPDAPESKVDPSLFPISPERPALPPRIPHLELIRRIGRGAFGDVWIARTVTGAFRAVKIIYRREAERYGPFEREFNGLRHFEPVSRCHAGLVQILHSGRDDNADCFYYVMELADDVSSGQHIDPENYVPKTLRSELARRGRLPANECLQIGLALTGALAYLHEHGLVHRDIKPSNIIFVNGQPKLADVGLVVEIRDAVSIAGTEGYIPREGLGKPTADIYALGKVLYELCSGKDRMNFPEPPSLLGDFEDRQGFLELNEVVLQACESAVEKRYQSAEEMQADLALLLGGQSLQRLHQVERRLRFMTRTGLAAAAILILGAFPYWLAVKEARMARREAQRAGTAEQATQRVSYSRAMLLAFEAARENNFGLVRELLKQTRSGGNEELPTKMDPVPKRSVAPSVSPAQSRLAVVDESASVLATCETSISAIAVSPDGKWLAAGEVNGQTHLWSLADRQSWHAWQNTTGHVTRLAFSPQSDRLAMGFSDAWVRAVRVPSGDSIAEYRQESRILDLHFCGNGRYLHDCSTHGLGLHDFVAGTDFPKYGNSAALAASLSSDDQTLVTSNPGWVICHRFGPYRSSVFPEVVAFGQSISPDNQWLALPVVGQPIEIWSMADFHRVRSLAGQAGTILAAAWAPDSQRLASGGSDGTVTVWDAKQGLLLRQWRGHQGDVNALVFSADGNALYSGGDDKTVRVWTDLKPRQDPPAAASSQHLSGSERLQPVSGTLPTAPRFAPEQPWERRYLEYECRDESTAVLTEGQGNVAALVVSPNGQWLAAGTSGGRILLWNFSAGPLAQQSPRQLQLSKPHVEFLCFSDDSQHLGAGCLDGAVFMLRFPSGEIEEQAQAREKILSMGFSADGATLSYCSEAGFGTLTLGGGRTHLTRQGPYASSAAISPNIRAVRNPRGLLLSTTNSSSFEVFPSVVGNEYADQALAISPDGHWLAVALADHSVELWSLPDRKPIRRLKGHSADVRVVSWSPDSRRLASGSYDQSLIVWDVPSGTLLRQLRGHKHYVASLAFSLDGQTLYSGSHDGSVRTWTNLATPPVASELPLPAPAIDVILTPGARFAYGTTMDNAVWSVQTKSQNSLSSFQQAPPDTFALSPDGQWMVAHLGSDLVRVCRFKDQRFLPVAVHKVEGSVINRPAFSPDGRRVGLLNSSGVLKVHQFEPWKELQRWDCSDPGWKTLHFDPSGERVFLLCPEFGVIIAEVQSGRLIRIPKATVENLSSLAISPNNRLLAVATFGSGVLLWSCPPGEEPRCLGPISSNTMDAWSVAFSPDGGRLAVGWNDGTIQIWDVEHRLMVGVLRGHERPVRDLGFNPDDDSLVSISRDALRVWHVLAAAGEK